QNERVYPEIRMSLAAAYAGMRRLDDARREFEVLAANDFRVLDQRSGNWLVCLGNLAQTCVSIGDAARARPLYALLHTYAGRAVVTLKACSCIGPVDRYLGLLAHARGEWDIAAAHFEDSLELCRRLSSPPFICWTQQNYGAMLRARGRAVDRCQAE